MRVARIITSQHHREDEDELTRQLQAAGYEVEVAAPGQAGLRAADLEVDLEYLPAEQALEAAMRMADDGADVFIAPGVFPGQVAPAPAAAEPPTIAAEPVLQTFNAAEPQPQAEVEEAAEEAPAPSIFQRVGIAWSERQQRAEERRLERERRGREEQERRRQEALELQRRREQEERARVERLRLAREQMAREAALRAERARLIEENERRRAAQLQPQPARQEPDRRWLAAVSGHTQQPPARDVAASPTSTVAAARAALPAAKARPALRPPLRIASRRERRWQRAALLASLVALMAMLGFAIAMNLHPVAPLPSQMLQNNAQQKVPFGAATITPVKPARAAPVAATATRATATSPPRKSASRPSAGKEGPVRQVPRARRSGNRSAADDEVVVRHFGSPNSTRAQSDSIRRISDQ